MINKMGPRQWLGMLVFVYLVASVLAQDVKLAHTISQNIPLASKIGLAHKSTRWSGLENLSRGSSRDQASHSLGDNEISTDGQERQQGQQHQYACGRSLANKKRGDLSSFDLVSTSRSKYRPLEIRTPRIIGGDETNPGEFPWTVSVKLNGQPICGGSLINKNWILTAAHCVVGYSPKNLTVRLGAYRIKDPTEQQIVDSPISLFVVHKQYSMPRPFSNDIALLKMAQPVEYSDFIIPICLPTEDQISTSLVNEIANDYLPKTFTSPNAPSATTSSQLPATSEDFETSDGIVVSTKMSDKEISKCFKRLEQNYLNSIGLGSSGALASSNDDAPTTAATIEANEDQRQQDKIKNYLVPPMPVDLLPVKMASQLESATNKRPAEKFSTQASDSNSPLGPMFFTSTNNEDSLLNNAAENNHVYELQTATNNNDNNNDNNNNNNNKITFPDFSEFNSNFKQAQVAQSQHSSVAYNRRPVDANHGHNYQMHESLLMNNQHAVSEHQNFNNYQAYYQEQPWNQRKTASEKETDQQLDSRIGAHLNGGEQKAIKLTSLPISKELLREIQSVGSMQSLYLGLQQGGNFVSMADDLGVASMPSGYAADRERVMSTPNVGHHGSTRQITRDTGLLSNELTGGDTEAERTKYSGMTGIVVGWGWIRENDNDGEQSVSAGSSQRTYQSVTLQKVRLPILRNSDCEAWFRSQEKKITLLPSQFCAGFNLGGKDACRGDSGGPMIIEDNSDTGRYKLIGIVSAGIGCARPSLPGLYTRVASFLPWIHAQMQHH